VYLIEDVLQLELGERRALHVFDGIKLPRHLLPVLALHWEHPLLGKLVLYGGILSKIDLGTDYEARDSRAMVANFWDPLFADVLEGGGRSNGEAHKEDVSLWVGERAESVIVFLTGGIEEA